MSPLIYGAGVIFAVVLTWGSLGHIEASDLSNQLKDLQASKFLSDLNYETCDRALAETNDMIIRDSVEYERKLSEREVITVEKIIPKYITLDKGDCNETSNVLEFIRLNHP